MEETSAWLTPAGANRRGLHIAVATGRRKAVSISVSCCVEIALTFLFPPSQLRFHPPHPPNRVSPLLARSLHPAQYVPPAAASPAGGGEAAGDADAPRRRQTRSCSRRRGAVHEAQTRSCSRRHGAVHEAQANLDSGELALPQCPCQPAEGHLSLFL